MGGFLVLAKEEASVLRGIYSPRNANPVKIYTQKQEKNFCQGAIGWIQKIKVVPPWLIG